MEENKDKATEQSPVLASLLWQSAFSYLRISCGLIIVLLTVICVVAGLILSRKDKVKPPKRKRTMVDPSVSKRRVETLPTAPDVLVRYYLQNPMEWLSFLGDSMLHEKVIHRAKEVASLTKSSEICANSHLFKTCHLPQQPAFRRNGKDLRPVTISGRPRPSYMDNLYSVRLCNKGLREVPSTLGYRCMDAVKVDLSLNDLFHLRNDLTLMRRLEELNLAYNMLTYVPMSFSNFHHLQTLDLRSNFFSEFPRAILGLTTLKTLQLDNNQLSRIPEEISSLRKLVTLNLGFNSLSEIPASLFTIRTLKVLTACTNYLKAIPGQICQAFALEEADFSHCCLTRIPPTIGRCLNLKVLRLGYNLLKQIPCEIAYLPNLVELDIDATRLEYLPAALLGCKYHLSIQGYPLRLSRHLRLDEWTVVDFVPEFSLRNHPGRLLDLTKSVIKEQDLYIGVLPHLLQEDVTRLHSCNLCGYAGMKHYISLKRTVVYNGTRYPFLFTFCRRHFSTGNWSSVAMYVAQMKEFLQLYEQAFLNEYG